MGRCPATDIFVILQPGDFAVAARCVASLRENPATRENRICVVTAALPGGLRSQLDAMGCSYLHTSDVCSLENNDPLLLQFLRWELRRYCSTATYGVVDAATVLPIELALWKNEIPVLFCENQFRFGQLMCFNYFFGQIPYPTSPASSVIAHFSRDVVNDMVTKIQGRWKTNWMHATIAILQQVPGTVFNAADAFGHYLNLFHPGTFEFHALNANPILSKNSPVVRMATLGFNGRFANQIFQYAFLRLYAKRHDLVAECPPWIGCSLFGHADPLSHNILPIFREDKGETQEMIRFDPAQSQRNFELWGYFQDPKHWVHNRQQFRQLFQPLPFLKTPLDDALVRLRGGGKTLVALHLRRGDFNGGPVFWPAPESWYLDWLSQIWPTLNKPVLYIATDDPQNVLPHFAHLNPTTAVDLNVTINGAEFYSDFYVLSQCDVLGISNSTFSFAAAMLNQTASVFVRPEPDLERLIDFDPWSSQVQLQKSTAATPRIAA